MARIIKKEPQTHAVIVDTNILWDKDKKNIVNPEFNEFWKEQCANFTLKLYVPEVVIGELLFQQVTSAIKAKKNIDELMVKVSIITEKRYRHRITDDEIKTQVELKLDKWLKFISGKKLVTPYNKIKWKDLVKSAVWRIPPFEYDEKKDENEKGFRDAVILETVVNFYKTETRDVSIAFICNDRLLREATEVRISNDSRFSIYESMLDFGSYLKLTQEELTNQFIKSILRKASKKFFKQGDPSCLFEQVNLNIILKEEFKKYFEEPTLSEKVKISPYRSFGGEISKWSPITSGTFWIDRAQFNELKKDNIYQWKNTVTYTCLYEKEIFNQPESTIFSLSEAQKRVENILILTFHVFWKSKVTKDARFLNLEIEDVKLEENEFRLPTEEEVKKYGFDKPNES